MNNELEYYYNRELKTRISWFTSKNPFRNRKSDDLNYIRLQETIFTVWKLHEHGLLSDKLDNLASKAHQEIIVKLAA